MGNIILYTEIKAVSIIRAQNEEKIGLRFKKSYGENEGPKYRKTRIIIDKLVVGK